ncbi:MAG: ribosome maturation factor RimM [Methylophilaceae bacterium]
MKTETKDLVIMGRIIEPYGLLGWLKVNPDTEYLDGLLDYKTWWIGQGDSWHEFTVESAKTHNDVLVVKLEGINERDGAFACKGKQVAVVRALLPKLEENEYYWSDLIGLAVKNQQGLDFGRITEVLETGANDVIVVQGDKERLIPFISQTILDVSLENQTMLVDWDADF